MARVQVFGVEQFKGLTDLPLYSREPGWCSTIQNMRLRPGGYLENRGGFSEMKPTAGTGADPMTSGVFAGGHEHIMSDGVIFTHDYDAAVGNQYSANLSQRAYFQIWPTTAAVEDAIYIGSDTKFSRVTFHIGQGTYGNPTDPTFAYEYYNGSTWAALTTTSYPNFEGTGDQTLEFDLPSNWATFTRGDAYNVSYTGAHVALKYWVRIRISAIGNGISTAVWQSGASESATGKKVRVDWGGQREVFVATVDPADSAAQGTVKRFDLKSTNPDVEWNSVGTGLFSGNYPSYRFATNRNILYFVNGKDQKRWDGNALNNIGFTAPAFSASSTAAAAGGDLGDGQWLYAMTFGYGPAGEWGESGYTQIGDLGTTVDAGNESVNLKWTFSSTPASGIVDVLYIYRTPNLTSVPASAQATFPHYRIATLYRDAGGTLPQGDVTADYNDDTVAFPFPPKALNIVDLSPPTNCKFIVTHKNRMFLGSNNQYPGRVWWSEPFELESFDTDENFSDFTRSSGGQLRGMVEFNDQVVCFTEDQMFGVANVDQEIPSIYVIHPGVGCVAPDSIAVGQGVMMWLAQDGFYLWDGNGPPRVISSDLFGFQASSYNKFGKSRAAIHNSMYDIYLVDGANAESGAATYPRMRYDLITNTWSSVTLGATATWGPLAVVDAPLGHADAGVRHALYGQVATGQTDYQVYLGEYTTQDNGNNYTSTVVVHFGPSVTARMSPRKLYAVYEDSGTSAWGTPALNFPQTQTDPPTKFLGDTPTAGTTTTDVANDYTLAITPVTNRVLGSGNVTVRFTVATDTGSGDLHKQRLLGMYLEGEIRERGLES